MIRFTWLQSRTQNAVALGGLLIVAAALAVSGPHLAHLYDTTVAACKVQGNCETATEAFLRNDNALRTWLSILVIVIPAVTGIFWGAPLVAREIEAGTYRLVWTQSITRTRWLAIKLGIIGLAGMTVAGLLSLMVTWWASPLDRAAVARFGIFDQRDLVPIGYAAIAFALAVTAGVVIRRTLPAMASALIAFVATRLAMTQWVRPHLLASAHAALPVTAARGLGFTPGPSGVTFVANAPSIPNAWVLSSRIVDQAGQTATPRSLHQFLATACPNIATLPARPTAGLTRAPADRNDFQECISKLSAKFHLAVTYQPPRHYWLLQWYEMAIFIAVAVALAGFCFWWLHRRHA
jgi:hypothetical protein